MSVANVEDTTFTQGQEPGGQGEGGKTWDNWVLKVGRSTVKGKDMGKLYLKGKPDPGLGHPVLQGGCTPQSWCITNPPSAGNMGWGQGDIPQNQSGRWLEMH